MKLHLALLVGLCVLPLSAVADTLTHVRIDTPQAPAVAASLIAEGFDVLPGTVGESSLELIVSAAERALLEGKGYAPVTLATGRPFREIQAERDVPPGYLDLSEILDEMNKAAATYPAICQVVDLTTRLNTPLTYEGRHLLAMRISDNVSQDEDEPQFMLVSAHHAREIVTPVIALHAIEQFTKLYGTDPQITDLVNEYEIWIAPVWNPDGYVYVFEVNNMWRKNRRVFPEGVGVDQNRNYPFGWDSPCGGSTVVTSQTYRGPAPASEAETQTMIALAEKRPFVKVADYHSYAREVRYGFGCWNHPFDAFLQSEAAALAGTMAGYSPATSCCTAGDIHYHMGTKGTHAFLWETETEFQPEYARAQAEAKLVFASVLFFLERPISISGHVTDVVTSDPLEASLTYVGVNFENGETNGSGGRFGRYHGILPPGNYTLEFSAEGYLTQTHEITVTASSAQVLDVQLVPRALSIQLVSGPGELIPPGTAPVVEVEITPGSQQVVPGSETVFYRYDGGGFISEPLTPLGGHLYTATLPLVGCGDTPEYYFSAEGDQGTVVTLPPDAPASTFAARVGEITVIMHDNFETNMGWTVENLGATNGDWERGKPVNDPNWAYDPISDSDGSGQCYLTENALGNTDVDNGAVRLTSPTIDMTGDEIAISYDYYLYLTDTTGGVDRMLVEIDSNDGAGPWTEIARHDTNGGLDWWTQVIDEAALKAAGVTLTSTMKLRFTTNDADPQSINESGLDAFWVTSFTCDPLFKLGDLNCDGVVNFDDIDPFVLALSGQAAYQAQYPNCRWLNADCNQDGKVDFDDIDPFVALLIGGG